MWTICSDVSIQRRYWQPLSVLFLAFCTDPTHDVTDVWRLATPPGCMFPTLLEQCFGFFYVPQEPAKCKCCVLCPYLWRLESLTICRCHFKGSTFSSVIKDPECWSGRGLNPWPPTQQTSALPTDLTRQLSDWLALFGGNGLINSFLGWKKCCSLYLVLVWNLEGEKFN